MGLQMSHYVKSTQCHPYMYGPPSRVCLVLNIIAHDFQHFSHILNLDFLAIISDIKALNSYPRCMGSFPIRNKYIQMLTQ